MTETQKDLETVKSILGSLPELDPIYEKAAIEIWNHKYPHEALIPYFLYKLYTKEELEVVLCLPGSSADVSKKLNKDEARCKEILEDLFHRGRIEALKMFDLDTIGSYAPPKSRGNLFDHMSMAYNRDNRDLCEEKELFLLADAWISPVKLSEEECASARKGTRILPKWEAIKDVPGVMHCENMHEIFFDYFKEGTLSWQKCVCRAHNNLQKTGHSIIKEGCVCKSGLIEHDNREGHCLWFGQRVPYMEKIFNIYVCKDLNEAERCFKECEESVTIYNVTNNRNVISACVCCEDCCVAHKNYLIGNDIYTASRFRPEVKEDKCVGCKLCQTRCMFHAISYNADDKCVVNPDNCKGCGNCVIKCPTKALKMKTVHDTDWIPE